MKIFRAYLAGPDVFLPNPMLAGMRKKDICTFYGLEGVFPLDSTPNFKGVSRQEMGYIISAENEALIRSCDLVVANMTPFRGPSCDVGTAYEMGFGRALGLPVFAYSNIAVGFTERTKQYLGTLHAKDPQGVLRDDEGMQLEDFGLWDNLMLDGGVRYSGGEIVVYDTPWWDRYNCLHAFEECVSRAVHTMEELSGTRIHEVDTVVK
jgi:nucleoside 2-deoxyribosyltransferase